VLGIVPMAIGLGEGGEQNAPLGRAVIGGLLFGTPATLVLVPSILAVLGRRQKRRASAVQGEDFHPTGGEIADAGVPS
jgi:Cu/Ag efflux pump CusA